MLNDLDRLDDITLHVHDTDAEVENCRIATCQFQVIKTLAGELEHELVDVRLKNRGKQKVVVTLPCGSGEPVPVADVEGEIGVYACRDHVDGPHDPFSCF